MERLIPGPRLRRTHISRFANFEDSVWPRREYGCIVASTDLLEG